MTPRYVLMLVGQLPPEAAFRASMQGGPDFRAWTPTAYLQAATVNLLNAANRQRAGKRSSGPLIKPPTQKPKARVLSIADIAARQRGRTESAFRAAAEGSTQDTAPDIDQPN